LQQGLAMRQKPEVCWTPIAGFESTQW